MSDNSKIDLAKVYAWRFLEPHNEFGADDYEQLYRLFKDFRIEIEKEFETRDKRYTRIDENYTIRELTERLRPLQRDCPDILANTTKRKYDNPKEIRED